MPVSAAKKGTWALGAAIVLIIVAVVALPLIASTQIVRDGIARQLSIWSGYQVELGQSPRIQVWPSFRAVLHDVDFVDRRAPNGSPVIEAERVDVDLSALAALRGEIIFTRIYFVRPTILVANTRGLLLLPPTPRSGKLAQSVDVARSLLAANSSSPDTSSLPVDPFGTVEIEGGKIRSAQKGEIVSGLSAKLNWSALNRPATLSASGIWHGEGVTIEASAEQPLLLFAGGNTPIKMTLSAAPMTASFEGLANVSADPFADGQLKLSSPSLRRLLEWTGFDANPSNAVGSFALAAKFTGNGKRGKFENAQLALDGNSGTGVLDMAFSPVPPKVTGTLAFKSLDLPSFLAAFTPLPPDPKSAETSISTSEANGFNLDLRLSAAAATAGSIKLSDIAATAQVKDGLAAFDISDARAFGGNIQFGMRVDRQIGDNLVELRMSAEDIKGSELAAMLGAKEFIPQGSGTLSIILKGTGREWNSVLESADGSVSGTFGKGTIPGIELAAFLSRNAKGGFFPLSEVSGGSLAIEGAEIKATISKGVARIDKAEARSGKSVISLGGLIPFAGRGIALSGTIAPAAPTESGDDARAVFFVGGSWSDPFVSPVLPGLPPR
ncbi:AsmA protein [Mesorhizobium sp. J18]|uniref:AsmA family protein n=1 Tax=Mesorhizobium sp. J18 TaxID=935263 RepID=UPI001199F138|nr:AsmA-like C-terminal region-containing protein [Mesorhizobium sp. J18]TWH00609.1 AsmA protein [Mesorhizobium sp. J18]